MDDLVNGNVLDDNEEDDIARIIEEADDTQLCCGKGWSSCRCDKSIPATDIYDVAEPYWYEDDTACMNCAFILSPACPPLRDTYKKFKETGVLDESITPCGSFRLI
jgi:hypothetical protein